MPDKSLLGISCNNTLYDKICSFILLVSADYFILLMLLLLNEKSEELEDIHHLLRCDHILRINFDVQEA